MIQSERHTRASAAKRLQQLGAVEKTEYRKPGEATYFSGSANVWLLVRQEGAGYVVEIHSACPC